MNAWEIVGFTIPGEAFCINCMDEDPDDEEQTPVFASDEAATELTCGECGEPLLESDSTPSESTDDFESPLNQSPSPRRHR